MLGYEGWADAVRELTGGEGAAAVYDGIGKATFLDGLRALRPTGKMILYGAASGQPDPLAVSALAPAGSLYVQRPTLGTYTRTPELLRDRARRLFELVAGGRLDVRIGGRYPLGEARRAHEDLRRAPPPGSSCSCPALPDRGAAARGSGQEGAPRAPRRAAHRARRRGRRPPRASSPPRRGRRACRRRAPARARGPGRRACARA